MDVLLPIVLEFLEAAIHAILYSRAVYPPRTYFQRINIMQTCSNTRENMKYQFLCLEAQSLMITLQK